MDIVIGRTAPVMNDPSNENGPNPNGNRVVRRDRRKNRQDRRRSVRDGIIVKLSVKNDRRILRDRRRARR